MRRKIVLLVGMLIFPVFLFGCSSSQVKRVAVDKTIDFSGLWNDTDSRLVAQEMVADSLSRPWITQFMETNHRDPVIIVGNVTNRSQEHINSEVFTKDLEMSLINSGRVKFVAASGERSWVREERNNQQQGLTDPETIKKIGKETGADFILIGSINSVKDEIKGQYVILYQTNLELVDLTTNLKVWIGQKQLKKIVKRSKYSL
jgi:penicillin-binding protein activator